jgi:serine/threonine protein kinase
MPPPNITADELRALIPCLEELSAARPPSGQKLVFPCRIAGREFVLKVVACGAMDETASTEMSQPNDVFLRAQREVSILQACTSPHLPRIGPIALTELRHNGERLIVFSEEFINGHNLDELFSNSGSFSNEETIRLGRDVATAVLELWNNGKIHRDIKPANIMRRAVDGTYVLLDPGIAFDQIDDSITGPGVIPHTPGYLAPELTNAAAKRDADVRADLFLLGIVMYFALTGIHPFISRAGQSPAEIIRNILTIVPAMPTTIRPQVSVSLSRVVMRLLEKQRHRRFKSCDKLIAALSACGLE